MVSPSLDLSIAFWIQRMALIHFHSQRCPIFLCWRKYPSPAQTSSRQHQGGISAITIVKFCIWFSSHQWVEIFSSFGKSFSSPAAVPPEHPEMPSDGLSGLLAKMINTTSKMAAARVMRALRGICANNNIRSEILNLLIIKLKIKNQLYPSLMIPFEKKFLLQKMLLMEICTY